MINKKKQGRRRLKSRKTIRRRLPRMRRRPRFRIKWLVPATLRWLRTKRLTKWRQISHASALCRRSLRYIMTRNISKEIVRSRLLSMIRSPFIGAMAYLRSCSFVPSVWLYILRTRLEVLPTTEKSMKKDKANLIMMNLVVKTQRRIRRRSWKKHWDWKKFSKGCESKNHNSFKIIFKI